MFRKLSTSVSYQLLTRGIKTNPQHVHFPAFKQPMLAADCFKGQTILVTGGATGLGKGMATMLSNLGAKVCIASRNVQALQDTSSEISEITKNEVFYYSMDIRDHEKVSAVADQFVEDHGIPNAVVNNAAGNFIAPSERLSAKGFNAVTSIVLQGTFNVTSAFGKKMIEEKTGGTFLNITVSGFKGTGFVLPSACAKAGVDAMTHSLASEWGRYGIRMNSIGPGPIYTKGAFSRLDPGGEGTNKMVDQLPVGRVGQVEELANLACYLVHPASSWLTGQRIDFDGGLANYMGGMFNGLSEITPDQWDMIEKMIRSTKGS